MTTFHHQPDPSDAGLNQKQPAMYQSYFTPIEPKVACISDACVQTILGTPGRLYYITNNSTTILQSSLSNWIP